MKIEADLVIVNANIITMDPRQPRATALAAKSFKLLAVGTDEIVMDFFPHSKRVMDLGGLTVIPGFVDGHTHITSYGIRSSQVDLQAVQSAEEAIQAIKAVVSNFENGEWIIAWNYDESNWIKKRYLKGKDLDKVSKVHPVVAIRVDGHLLSVNTLGLEKIGVDLDHEGVEKDKNGNPTGILKDIEGMTDKLRSGPDEVLSGIIAGSKIAASLGITTAVDNIASGQLHHIRRAEELNRLSTRIIVNIPEEQLNSLIKIGITSSMGTPMTRIAGIKIFTDGSIGAATAAVFEPYLGQKDNTGMLLYDKKKYSKLLKKSIQAGIQTVTHAIGGRAIEMVISAFENLSEEEKHLVRDQRHRIEHAEMIQDGQIRRAVTLGLILSMQPNFVGEWQLEGGLYDDRLGPERAAKMNNFRVALDNGARVCFGSDGMPLGPLYGIYSATTHPNPKVRISVDEALRCYTLESAYASLYERSIGSLVEGKRADLVVLSDNILEISPEKIKDIKVEMTVLGGQIVYSGPRT
ncbi:MAG: amidohydrolase [Candidatus Thorarchaeota archaeon]